MELIGNKWDDILADEYQKEYFKKIVLFINKEYKEKTIFPQKNNILRALSLTDYDDVKVVILGQDPYHGVGEANGLAFSVNNGVSLPPSLKNIFIELHNDLGCYIPNNGNLTKWARQGVLMLNSVLTVRANQPNSHKGKGWEQVTTAIINELNKREKPVVFLLWGANAKNIGKNIDTLKHFVLTSAHPSPMSANQGGWFGNHHFSKTNDILRKLNEKEIDWQIENI